MNTIPSVASIATDPLAAAVIVGVIIGILKPLVIDPLYARFSSTSSTDTAGHDACVRLVAILLGIVVVVSATLTQTRMDGPLWYTAALIGGAAGLASVGLYHTVTGVASSISSITGATGGSGMTPTATETPTETGTPTTPVS